MTDDSTPSHPLITIAMSPDLFTGLRGLARHLAERHSAQLLFVVTATIARPGSITVHYDTLSPEAARQRNTVFANEPWPLAAFRKMPAQRDSGNQADLGWLTEHIGKEFAGFVAAMSDDPVVMLPTAFPHAVLLSALRLGPRPATHTAGETADVLRDYYEALATLLASHPLPIGKPTAKALVTAQEAKVLDLCALGLTDKEIAREMGISPHTVRAHLANAKRKLNARNKTHTVMRYKGLD